MDKKPMTEEEIFKAIATAEAEQLEIEWQEAEQAIKDLDIKAPASIDKRIKQLGINPKPLRKAYIKYVAAAVICLVLIGTTVFTYPQVATALREFFHIIKKEQHQGQTITFNIQEDLAANQILERLTSNNIPQEYNFVGQLYDGQSAYKLYQNQQGKELAIFIYAPDTKVLFDFEDAEINEVITINNRPASVISKKDTTIVLWHYQQYTMKLRTVLPIKQAIELADSLEISG